jgi:hypothetical protein
VQSAEEAWPSADVIYEELRHRVALQLEQVDSLDGKANFVLGSASLLTAGVAALRNAAEPTAGQAPERWCVLGWNAEAMTLVNIVIACAFAAFVGVVWCSFQAYRVRTFTVTPEPIAGAGLVFQQYLGRPEGDTKVMLSNSRVRHDSPTMKSRSRAKRVGRRGRSRRYLSKPCSCLQWP